MSARVRITVTTDYAGDVEIERHHMGARLTDDPAVIVGHLLDQVVNQVRAAYALAVADAVLGGAE